MIISSEVISSFIDCINNQMDLPNTFVAIKGFEETSITTPIEKTYLSFSCEEQEAKFFEDENSEYCKDVDLTIRMNCFIPLIYSVSEARNKVEEILSYLSDKYRNEVLGYKIYKTDHDDKVNAYILSCYIFLGYNVCSGDDTTAGELVEQSNFFCFSHVTDQNIHVDEEWKDYVFFTLDEHVSDELSHVDDLFRAKVEIKHEAHVENDDIHVGPDLLTKIDQNVVTGYYDGLGYGTTKVVDVGFRPKALIIFAGSVPMFQSGSGGRNDSYFGFATEVVRSQGITLNDSGFSVRQNIGDQEDDSLSLICNSGTRYGYIAFR